jgi:hypothetical protein
MCSYFSVVDLFIFEEKGHRWSSVTFELCFENPNGDLSADAVNTSLQSLIQQVSERYGEEGIYQR